MNNKLRNKSSFEQQMWVFTADLLLITEQILVRKLSNVTLGSKPQESSQLETVFDSVVTSSINILQRTWKISVLNLKNFHVRRCGEMTPC